MYMSLSIRIGAFQSVLPAGALSCYTELQDLMKRKSPGRFVKAKAPRRFGMEEDMKAAAYCGLACCVCSHREDCPGCQDGGCESHASCKNYNCCREKGLNGCWECADFPCGGSMLDNPRIRAFAEFVRRYGMEELESCLLRNRENGIVYHYEGQLVGDYDRCRTEEDIISMIKNGRKAESL